MKTFVLASLKALVPVALAGVVTSLSTVGVTPEMTVEEALAVLAGGLVTGVGVWLTPNK